jgi:glycosyltransferase involved in cell wall biosynthesis
MEAKKYIYIVQVTRQLSIDIINEFAGRSHPVVLLTGSIEKQHTGLHQKVKIKLFNRYRNSSMTGRIFSGLWFHLRCFFYVLFHGRKAELILVSTPPFIPFLGLFFFRWRQQKFHLLIWDLYPDVLIRMKALRSDSLLNTLWSKRNTSLFRYCSSLITLGNHMASSLAAYTNRKASIVPPWADTSYVQSIIPEQNQFIKKHGLENKLVVLYAGNLGITHPVEIMIKAAEQLKEEVRIQFVIIGEGEKKNRLYRLKEEAQLNNVLLLPYQNPEMFPQALASAQVSVVTLSSRAADVSVPSKTFTAMAAGAALLVIGSENSSLGELIKQYRCGEIFPEWDLKNISAFIIALARDPALLARYRQHSMKASQDFSPANAGKYYNLISQS